MKVHFWGVRGSTPTPITPQQVRSKITAVVQRITPKDISSADAREKFLSSLPGWIFGTIGGNTPCIEITDEKGTEIVLDAGSGLRVMGKFGKKPESKTYNLFFSHFHWDHIQGLPFFDAAYDPATVINIYSTFPAAERILRKQMDRPYYPVPFEVLTKNFNFHCISEGDVFQVGDFSVCCCKMSHPGNSYSYAFKHNGKHFVYATDVELSLKDFKKDKAHTNVFANADVIVLDSQYTVSEAYQKENWGHSAFCHAIDFSSFWNIKSIYLFHHEPTYDDKKIDSILKTARWYAQYVEHTELEIYVAQEGQEINL